MTVRAFLMLTASLGPLAMAYADDHPHHTVSTPGERTWLILNQLPLEASQYQPRAAALIEQRVPEKFGHEEWAAIVLTNEFHQHMGIYSIIGAKMGIRAKELLEAPPRSVDVTVETGPQPPISCIIDGLQVALGSTTAQGLMHVPETQTKEASAVFAFKTRRVRLSLTPDARRQIEEAIAGAVKSCGNLTPAYFAKIEELSYDIWAKFDRRTIFTVEELHEEGTKK